MALWQIIDGNGQPVGDPWDDGLTKRPGNEGFSTDRIVAHAGSDRFNYIGTPNWEPPEDDAEA